MDTETEITHLKAKVQALEAVHGVLLGLLASIATLIAGEAAAFLQKDVLSALRTPEQLLDLVRQAIKVQGGDARYALLAEQHIEDAIHQIERGMKTLRPDT
jgi:hypothetical protein